MPRKNTGPVVRQRKDTGKWGILEYRQGNRHWIISGYDSQRECEEAFEIWKSERRGKCHPDQITVGECLKFYLENHLPHTRTTARRISMHDRLTPFWASLKVSEVTKAKCQEYCTVMNAQRTRQGLPAYSNDTLRTYLDHLQAALQYAWENEKLETAPRKLWKPAKTPPVERWYTRKEIARLRHCAKKGEAADYLPLFILLAVYTGCRPGAILNLRWPYVDFENEEIDFKFAQTSRNKGYAVVPMPPKLKRELLRHRGRGTEMGYVLHRDQKPMKSVKTAWRTLQKRTGIKGTIKDLRRTHGSWLKQGRIPSSFIAKNLAHSSTITTDRVYAHLDESYKKVIKDAF